MLFGIWRAANEGGEALLNTVVVPSFLAASWDPVVKRLGLRAEQASNVSTPVTVRDTLPLLRGFADLVS